MKAHRDGTVGPVDGDARWDHRSHIEVYDVQGQRKGMRDSIGIGPNRVERVVSPTGPVTVTVIGTPLGSGVAWLGETTQTRELGAAQLKSTEPLYPLEAVRVPENTAV